MPWRLHLVTRNPKPFRNLIMNTKRLIAIVLPCLLAAWAPHAAAAPSTSAKGDYEPAPVLAGNVIAPAALLKGPFHTVAEPVSLDGFFGRFIIESKFGKFSVVGVRMLGIRVHELAAIEALQQVQGSQAFKDSLLRSAAAPVQFVQSAVTDPLGTVENVGAGLGSVLGRIGFVARSGAQSVADSSSDRSNPQEPSNLPAAPKGETMPSAFTGDPFGFNKARRDWARQLNIDPYTTNPVLRPLLDNAATASFAGSFAINTALGAVSMPVNLVVEFDTTVRDSVWNQPVVDLTRQNESQLLSLGVDARLARDFLRNRWFTPSVQTALVSNLMAMRDVAGVQGVVATASRMQGETRARFLVESLQMLRAVHEKDGGLRRIKMSVMVPVGIKVDGTPVIAAAVDYVYWDKIAAEFAQRKEIGGSRRVLLLAGKASERSTKELEKAGFTVKAGLRP